MIALIVLASIAGLWAAIATGVAIAYVERAETYRTTANEWRESHDELLDRLAASSLSEYRTHRPVAMAAREPEPDWEYVSDFTGLVTERRVRES